MYYSTLFVRVQCVDQVIGCDIGNVLEDGLGDGDGLGLGHALGLGHGLWLGHVLGHMTWVRVRAWVKG